MDIKIHEVKYNISLNDVHRLHSNKEIDKKGNVSKIANNINTVGDDSTAAQCNSRLITVLVQHANDIVSVT